MGNFNNRDNQRVFNIVACHSERSEESTPTGADSSSPSFAVTSQNDTIKYPCNHSIDIEKLKEVLPCQTKQSVVAPGRIPSAVLLPIFCRDGEYHLLFIKRTERVKYHKGQISFPGGGYEKKDITLLDTALRETFEEVGIPPQNIEVLGCLNDVLAHTSNYIISPFPALVRFNHPLKTDPYEVEELIEVPISKLLDKGCVRQETTFQDGATETLYFYYYGERVIWGATARILAQFLNILQRLEGSSS